MILVLQRTEIEIFSKNGDKKPVRICDDNLLRCDALKALY